MPKEVNESITALGVQIGVASKGDRDDYISLTDIARYKSDEPSAVIANWMRNRDTIDFLGVWESLHNPDFNSLEFEGIEKQAGRNAFAMSPKKWISAVNAIGIKSKGGRYGGAYAHIDIAFEFASWISPEFKLYIIKDYQRLKSDENSRLSLEWNEKRLFAKINYRIHTDAVKKHLVPDISKSKERFAYANEADVINVALFGMTAKQWRDSHPDTEGNMRDSATLDQLIVLANLESMNAELIKRGMSRAERALLLNAMAIQQLEALADNPTLKKLGSGSAELPES
ncbi:KilA-N domain-containing protein [Adlercreutzia shanghongiae]|uniref:KilA-N domain-containing protein n=1 Tax=Adlercreutzia shanghongiae TaxID=3111773 RepID=A0ABU6IWT2_9ACTN|nr:KilA-N domain-containing protein [Adlercreutzia sp. R22]MEC4294009.1 KilA-N domain-containing protein [Adlercreutzia sp. R22]